MHRFLLRVEGVNLDAVMADTDQISVIRGSSLLLRAAVVELAEKEDFLTVSGHLETISKGASVGLFRGILNGSASIDDVVGELGGWLSSHVNYQYLTFVVDAVPEQGDFRQLREQLIAKNRIRQLQQVSLALPEWNDSPRVVACELDGARPAIKPFSKRGKSLAVSASFYQRFEYGRNQRSQFYEDETGLTVEVTSDFKALSEDPTQGNRHNKIALIYWDGNSFGDIQREHCTTVAAQQAFDEHIGQLRRNFLTALIHYAEKDPAFQTEDGELRLEVLMWGGDEILLVVPAWKGLDVLELFYRLTAGAEYEGAPLTHAGGIVFSQANTPIYRLRKLAESLANELKTVIKQADSPLQTQNAFDYLILESMDFPVEPLGALRQRQYMHQTHNRLGLAAFSAEALQAVRVILASDKLPRSQLTELSFAAVNELPVSPVAEESLMTTAEWQKKRARLEAVIGEDLRQGGGLLTEIDATVSRLFVGQTEPWHWLHLAELWDYLLPDKQIISDQRGGEGHE